jgi:Domain of unknown function (DUF4349)
MRYVQYTIILLLFLSCNRSENKKDKLQIVALNNIKKEEQMMLADTTAPAPPPPAVPLPGEPSQQKDQKQPSKPSANKPDWDKKIIKTATLNVEVKDYKKFNQQVNNSANQFGGYIADEQQTETDYKIENTVTIKVPVDQFQPAVDFLTTGNGKINEKKITSEDVTTQYVDTKSRLEAKRQVRLRYLDLLKQAKNMEEVLQVQSEINDIQEEIESAAGHINYLSNAAAMSTIHFTFYEVINASAKDTGENFWEKVKEAFISGWKGASDVLIGFIYIWPLIFIVIGGVSLAKRMLRKKDNKIKVEATV